MYQQSNISLLYAFTYAIIALGQVKLHQKITLFLSNHMFQINAVHPTCYHELALVLVPLVPLMIWLKQSFPYSLVSQTKKHIAL